MKRKFKKQAFSLIELLVVVALLAALSLMLIIGIDKLRTNARRQSTHLTLLNLQAMYSEADAIRHIPFGAGHLNVAGLDANAKTTLLSFLATYSPGNVADGIDRFGTATPANPTANPNRAVRYTRDFMAMLMQFPVVSAGISKMSSGSLMTFPPTIFSNNIALYNTGTVYPVANADPSVTSDEVSYSYVDPSTGNNVTAYFIRAQANVDSTGTVNADGVGTNQDSAMGPPNPNYWVPALPPAPTPSQTLPLSIPVVLDAWNNPIIVVMGGVLGAPINALTGTLKVNGNPFQVTSPDFRPFFASAGPDGDFSKGDDNLYSFEK